MGFLNLEVVEVAGVMPRPCQDQDMIILKYLASEDSHFLPAKPPHPNFLRPNFHIDLPKGMSMKDVWVADCVDCTYLCLVANK